MRKLLYSLIMSVLFSTSLTGVSAANLETNPNKYVKGNKSIEYIAEHDVFYLENITVQDVLDAFSTDENFKYSKKSYSEITRYTGFSELDIIEQDVLGTTSTRYSTRTTYKADYYLSGGMIGLFNEYVPINYGVTMVMTTVNVGGTEYAQFVRVDSSPGYALGSNAYEYSGGTQPAVASVSNGGATLEIYQWMQLETAVAYSKSAGFNLEWFAYEESVSSTWYFRSKLTKITAKHNLPLINIVQ